MAKNKYRLIILSFIIIIAVLTSGCFSSNSQKESKIPFEQDSTGQYEKELVPFFSDATKSLMADDNIDNELKVLFSQPDDYEKPPPDTFYNILREYEAGNISRDEQAKLFVLAAYAPELVPEKYKGLTEGVESPQFEIQHLVDNWDNLNPEIQKAVTPFIVPISQAESYWYPKNRAESISTYLPESFRFASVAHAAENSEVFVVHSFDINGVEIKITYYEHSSWDADKKLTYNMAIRDIEDALMLGWVEFEELLGLSPTKPLLVELLPLSERLYGQAWKGKDNYRIRIAASLVNNPELISATTVHELFHIFQFEMKLSPTTADVKWLMEATATWSEHYVYDHFNTEHRFLPRFFRTLHEDRISFGNNFEYCSYMLFYYLSDYAGNNIVSDILWETARRGPGTVREYLSEKVSGMKGLYADFALNNINEFIFKRYNDSGPLPGVISGKALSKYSLKTDDEKTESISLSPGAHQHKVFLINKNNEDIKHIDIYFDNRLDDDKYLTRIGIYRRYDGTWHYEDWSAAQSIHFCRNNKEDEIDFLSIVYANANFKKEGTNNPVDGFTIKTGRCPDRLDITINAEFVYKVEDFEWTSTTTLKERIKMIDHFLFLVETSEYSFSGNGVYQGRSLLESTGRYSMSVKEVDIHNSMARIMKKLTNNSEVDPEELKKFGFTDNTPPAGMFILVPAIKEYDTLKGFTKMYLPDPIGIIEMNFPMPMDGLSQIIAVALDAKDWTGEGLRLEREIDVFTYQSPMSDWFKADFSKILTMLPDANLPGADIDISSLLESQGIPGQQFNQPGISPLGGFKEMEVIKNAMLMSHKSPGEAILKLKVYGKYIE
ncbi:MAG: hypothetical protein KGZ63_09230 [Clostridiales bacterium]|jgi:hypothetical protein|nr:hypothetical protein [Clostridiales bacterium]